MTDDKTFERSAQAWLEQGPATAPQRSIAAALKTIQTTPQQRTLRVPRRFLSMFTPLRLAGAAAIVALALGGGYLLFARPPTVGIPSPRPSAEQSPSPSASPNSTATAITSADAQGLQAVWASVGTRPWPGVGIDQPTTIDVGTTVLRVPQMYLNVDSPWQLIGNDGHLQVDFQTAFEGVASGRQNWNCAIGELGNYHYELGSGGTTLYLEEVDDPCAARAAILAGDWDRTPCQAGEWGICQSALSVGRHLAPDFRPFGGGTLGRLAYSVPVGWGELFVPPTWTEAAIANSTQLSLYMQDRSNTPITLLDSVRASATILVPEAPPVECVSGSPTNARGVSQIAVWLGSRPYLTATTPTPVSIGGLEGVSVDVSAKSGWLDPCSYGQTDDGPPVYASELPVFSFSGADNVYLGGSIERARYILLDQGGGQTLLIYVQTESASDFDDLVAEAMPVINSFEFSVDGS